jgi:hypothetical protein
MLVDLAVSFDPGVELALADGEPGDEMDDRNLGLIAPCPDKVDYGVSRIMGNPDAC